MKTILISGGAGYFGTVLTQKLLKNNKVIVYDALYFPWLYKNRKKISFSKRLFFIKKNIQDVSVGDFKNVDVVCDLNGISNDPSSELNLYNTWKTNYYGRVKFAKIAKKAGVKKYVFNSTCSVYGYSKNIVFENSNKAPISTYAKANYKSEKKIFSLKSKKFIINILRNSTLYGYSNTLRLDLVINIFVYNLVRKKKIIIDGDGSQYRPFISLNDVSKVYEILLQKKYPSFICNLVSFNSTIRDIAKNVCKVLKINPKVIQYKNNNPDKRNYFVGSKVFKKYFKNFIFSSFKEDILELKDLIKKNKEKISNKTIRMKFYKKLF